MIRALTKFALATGYQVLYTERTVALGGCAMYHEQ